MSRKDDGTFWEFPYENAKWLRRVEQQVCNCDGTGMGGFPGYVYVLKVPEGYKIGATRDRKWATGYLRSSVRSVASLKERIRSHAKKVEWLEFVFAIYCACPFCLERAIHNGFHHRRDYDCEWSCEVFDLSPEDLSTIASVTQFNGTNTEWYGSLPPKNVPLLYVRQNMWPAGSETSKERIDSMLHDLGLT